MQGYDRGASEGRQVGEGMRVKGSRGDIIG